MAGRELDLRILQHLYKGLFKLDERLKPIPDTAYTVFLEEHTLKVSLKRGFKWSDGLPLSLHHYKDGLLRSLKVNPESPHVSRFARLLDSGCSSRQTWEDCIFVKHGQLIFKTQVAPAHLLPFLTFPFSFPQRLDILKKYREQPYLSPSIYPSQGSYRLESMDSDQVVLVPLDDSLSRLVIRQKLIEELPSIRDFQLGKAHVVEPPPLFMLENETWYKHLQAFPGFHLLGLQEHLSSSESSLMIAAYPPTIQSYITQKGLVMADSPKLLDDFIQACESQVPKIVLESSGRSFESPLTLVGPQDIFGFLVHESIQAQLLRNSVHHISYVAIPPKSLLGTLHLKRPSHALVGYALQIPSLLELFELFQKDSERVSASGQGNSFYNYLVEKYRQTDVSQSQEILTQLAKLLCIDEHWFFPLISVPVYAVIHPLLKHMKREGNGSYSVWKD
jgi:hypothetical protein